jgi:glutamate formiminotransferase
MKIKYMKYFKENDILIECVPNFSEGRDLSILNAIASEIKSVKNVVLLHQDIGYDANRTVFTFVGTPDAVVNAAFLAIQKAYELIDMKHHKGEHPRMGACDVCPLIPLQNISIAETVLWSKILGKRVGDIGIPVYLYEDSATNINRKNLAYLRKGEYESIPQKIKLEEWKPDFGTTSLNEKFGMMALGARKLLIAYNINLKTTNLEIGKKIAHDFRIARAENINPKIKYSKAIAWFIKAYNCVQISTNINDFSQTSIFDVFDFVNELSKKYNIETNGSELIGLIPKQALLSKNRQDYSEDDNIDYAIQYLGLNSIQAFNKEERILDYLL